MDVTPLAYSYLRFSHPDQIKGDSLRRQLVLAEQYAEKRNLRLETKSYRDLGISAFKGKNLADGALGAFLAAVDSGLIPKGSFLLLEGLDRLSRAEVDDALMLLLSITNRGITLVTLADGVEYSKESIKANWTQLILALAISARAHEESATKSRRVSAAVQAKIAKGLPLGSSMPSWVKLNEAKTGYVLIGEKVEIVRKVFDLALQGNGLYLISTRLVADGTPILGVGARGWTISHVSKILHSKAVIGTLVSKHGTFDDHYPVVIEKDSFFQVQDMIATRHKVGRGRKGLGVANLFSGLVKCGDCGGPMRFLRVPSGGHKNSYLECLVAYEKKGCTARRVNYDPFEREALKTLLTHVGVTLTETQAVDETASLRAELADKQAQIEKLMDLIEASDERSSKNLLGRLATRESELTAIQERLANARPVRNTTKAAEQALTEAIELLKRHAELRTDQIDELTELRLKLQSALKVFIDRIVMPSKIILGFDENSKWRVSEIYLRDGARLVPPTAKLEPDDLSRLGFEFDDLEYPLTTEDSNDSVIRIAYRVPQIGGYRVKGQRRVT